MEIDFLETRKIGFIGAGNMCHALVSGFVKKAGFKPENLFISAPSNRNLGRFAEMGCMVTNCNEDLLPGNKFSCTVIFLCVKPSVAKKCSKTNPFLVYNGNEPLIIISVLAGVTLKKLYQVICDRSFNEDLKMGKIYIYRIMPNTACSVGKGICGICHCLLGDTFDESVKSLLSMISYCEFVTEEQLNAIAGVGGSGIAFVYTFIQAMADGAVKMGLQRHIALNFAIQTFLGAALMAEQSSKHLIELRDEVCSPSGTTIHGIHALERNAVSSGIIDAVESATKRAEEFGRDQI
ncbi:pyrroline-5-carboxylate reductase 3-like protein [Dinothrombium tinctorium]|uniref:Pyrroline-5-carboxylate reductase 3 n=1 Tax=Dinothrombium tinctorium TaxID=1965070 RepID=A0A3S3Q1V2_9ACAR|nr:pyrroline-5-carboxylate reductase 3-like protein [Dinothrombium tinctorium]